ncbi:DREB2A-interacting protein 2 isoform 2 [Hibiscus syriacus]|uniref:DREB2A-interacting protein 2 isoform 2 n=1 Tax=Hibiscus syriacus TaxID=106335 RepID=A0A6A2WZ56_HIBSY|nr:DREB2A-interacting protein 2 isoform 2 [Hibiscus syriacus]
MANQVVKVRREAIAACMTCPLCNKLVRDATTISECLHTCEISLSFPSKKCIYDKIEDEDLECCPICNIDLGSVPLEKLRPDHTLQDVRAKIFPLKRRKAKAPEVLPLVMMPTRRKERSLSSLVVNVPNVSTQTTMTARRTKLLPKSLVLYECTSAEPSQHTDKEVENGGKSWDGKSDLWKPLDCLAEVANRNNSFKSNSQGSNSKQELTLVPNPEAQTCKNKGKTTLKQKIHQKNGAGFGDCCISPQAVLDAGGAKHQKIIGPVWFSLVASDDQDGNIPVSVIQKYLMKKLHLADEAEVEIKFMGQPVVPTLQLYNLVHWWLQRASTSRRVAASVGSSAKDFIMVLAYARKAPQQ